MAAVDKKDQEIVEVLRKNASLKTIEVAKMTGIPPTTVHNRIQKLIKTGVIKKKVAVIDFKKMGKDVIAYVFVKFGGYSRDIDQKVVKWLTNREEVLEAYSLAGTNDAIIKLCLRDTKDLESFLYDLRDHLKTFGVDYVSNESHIVMSEWKSV